MLISFVTALATPHHATFDIAYRWKNPDTGEAVDGWTTAHIEWTGDPTVARRCRARWARRHCGVGTFETDDGGTGVAELGATRHKGRRLRTLTLTYDGTDVIYQGDIRARDFDAAWLGVMNAPDPAWVGEWDEPLRVRVRKPSAFTTRRGTPLLTETRGL